MRVTEDVTYHFLYACSFYASKTPTQIQTVLGSCVSVCLFDQRLNFGGINHYMLPVWKGEGLATAKFGNIAIDKLLEKMLLFGAEKKNIVAKVFGGADSLGDNAIFEIGKRNIQLAEDLLSDYHIPIISSNVGGTVGRKILFHSGSGIVYMKFVNNQENKNDTENF